MSLRRVEKRKRLNSKNAGGIRLLVFMVVEVGCEIGFCALAWIGKRAVTPESPPIAYAESGKQLGELRNGK